MPDTIPNPAEPQAPAPAVVESAADDVALQTKVAEGLSNLYGDNNIIHDAPEPTDPKPDASAQVDETDTEIDENDVVDPEVNTDDEQKTGTEAAADESQEDSDAPTLPDSHRRTLLAEGYTDEQIDQRVEVLGDIFLQDAARMHDKRNEDTARWAEAGRQAKLQQQQDTPGQPQPQPTPAPQAQPTAGLQAIPAVDTVKLKEDFGEDALVDAIAGPVNAAINAINSVLPDLHRATQTAQDTEIEHLSVQIDTFFGSDELKAYGEFYGDGTRQLTANQQDKRNQLLETADALHTGAQLQGRTLTLEEALNKSHDLISKDFQAKAFRAEMTGKLKERGRSLSLRPSRSGGRQSQGGEGTIEERTAARMAKVFKS